jgi:hypothetical protein
MASGILIAAVQVGSRLSLSTRGGPRGSPCRPAEGASVRGEAEFGMLIPVSG